MPYLSENTIISLKDTIKELISHLNALSNNFNEPSSDPSQIEHKREELLKMKILTEENWEIFLNLFKATYKDYYQYIYNNYFEILSTAEFRLLMLLKLSTSNAVIASILGISKDSVRICIYRTRCKLSLNTKKELIDLTSKIP